VTTTEEYELIKNFCHQPGGLPVKFEELLRVAEGLAALSASSGDSQTNTLGSVRTLMAEEKEEDVKGTKVLRCLLVLEKILEEGIVSPNMLYALRKNLERWKGLENKQISIKAAKILAILEHLRSSKSA